MSRKKKIRKSSKQSTVKDLRSIQTISLKKESPVRTIAKHLNKEGVISLIATILIVSVSIFIVVPRDGIISASITIGDSIVYQVDSDSDLTHASPICGCMDSKNPRVGLQFFSSTVTLNFQSSDADYPIASYCITSPEESSIYSKPGYTFNASLYQIEKPAFSEVDFQKLLDSVMPNLDPITIFNKNWKSKKDTGNYKIRFHHNFANVPYLGIFAKKDLEIKILDSVPIMAFLSDQDNIVTIKKEENVFTKGKPEITIIDSALGESKYPRLDVLGQRIAMYTEEEIRISSDHGIIDCVKPSIIKGSFLNVLVLDVPWAARIAMTPTSTKMIDLLEYEMRLKLCPDATQIRIWRDIILLYYTASGEMKIPDYGDSTISMGQPITSGGDGICTIKIKDVLDEKSFNAIRSKIDSRDTKEVIFKKGTKELNVGMLEIDPSIDIKIIEDYKKNNYENMSAEEILNREKSAQKLFKKYLDTSQAVNIKDLSLDNKSAFFRYPPLSEKNEILIFDHLKSFTTNNATGSIAINDQQIEIPANALVELTKLSNPTFAEPTFSIPINEVLLSKEFKIKSPGKLRINNKHVGLKYIDNVYYIWSTIFFGIFGGILTVYLFTKDLIRKPARKVD